MPQGPVLCVLAVALGIAAVISGCSSSAVPEVTAAPAVPLSAIGAPMTTRQAQQALTGAKRNVRRAGSLRFSAHAQLTNQSQVTSSRTTGGWVDRPLSWEQTVVTDSPQPAKVESFEGDRKATALRVGPRIYTKFALSTWSWLRHWYVDTHATADGPDHSVTVTGGRPLREPAPVKILFLMKATSASRDGESTTVAGSIPNWIAVSQLDASAFVQDMGLVSPIVSGRTTVHLNIDSSGLPVSLEFTGAEVGMAATAVPVYVRDTIATGVFQATYFDFGRVPPFRAPPPQMATKIPGGSPAGS